MNSDDPRLKNIGKRCKITESTIAGLTGKEGTIIDIVGDEKRGYQYAVNIGKPLLPSTQQTVFYPLIAFCEILD